MTAPVAPMEARCEHCLDTGSLSKDMHEQLDCIACNAATERMALNKHLHSLGYRTFGHDRDWTVYLFAQRQAAPVAPHPEDDQFNDAG